AGDGAVDHRGGALAEEIDLGNFRVLPVAVVREDHELDSSRLCSLREWVLLALLLADLERAHALPGTRGGRDEELHLASADPRVASLLEGLGAEAEGVEAPRGVQLPDERGAGGLPLGRGPAIGLAPVGEPPGGPGGGAAAVASGLLDQHCSVAEVEGVLPLGRWGGGDEERRQRDGHRDGHGSPLEAWRPNLLGAPRGPATVFRRHLRAGAPARGRRSQALGSAAMENFFPSGAQ